MNRFLASCGVASRRGADALIAAGRIRIDGATAAPATLVDPSVHAITLDGRRVRSDRAASHVTLALNKPAGVVTTMRDERGRRSVADFLPKERRLFPVGRLDAQTTGLLLCTTDGALASFLTDARNAVPRKYQVVVRGTLDAQTRADLGAQAVKALPDGSSAFSLTLCEGRNRQVRRMCARQGLAVISLARVQFGPIRLGNLRTGSTRALSPSEMRELDRLRGERSTQHGQAQGL